MTTTTKTTTTPIETFAETVKRTSVEQGPRPHVKAARRMYHSDGEIEVDDSAVVSESGDDGEYVMAWVWVSDSDLIPADSK